MSSSIGPAGLAFAALLETAAATTGHVLNGVQIAFGPPDQYEYQEVVTLLGVSALAELARVLGPQPNVRDENYGLDFAVECVGPEKTAKEVWARGWAIYDAVRTVVLTGTGPKLNDTVMWALPTPTDTTGVVRAITGDGTQVAGYAIRIDGTVICKARA